MFVAPSTGSESFGIVLLEAMASARPIVCSDIEGYRAVVPAQGALRVAPRDPVRLGEAIAQLAADEAMRRRFGQANRAAALPYDWSRLAERVRAEYLAAIAVRRESAAPSPTPTTARQPR